MLHLFGTPLRIKKILLAGIAFAILAYVIHTAGAIATMKYYQDPAYFAVWSKLMMPGEGPPPPSFMYYSLSFSLIGGILFALVYEIVRSSFAGETYVKKGLYFGTLVFLVSGIPGFLSMYLILNLPAVLLLEWTLESLVLYLLNGVVVAKIID